MKKILIVEDDQIVSNIYRNKFSVEGYQVETAGDGEAGLEIIRKFRPDAVILDLMLPKLSGVELMKQVRAEPAFTNLPIFVFSNTYLSNLVQEAWKAGATKCLSKSSCSPKQLLDMIRNVFVNDGAVAVGAAVSGPAALAKPHTVNSPTQTTHTPGSDVQTDADFQVDVRRSFLANLPASLAAIRALHKDLIRAGSETAQLHKVEEMYRRVHGLSANASLTGLTLIAQMADGFEALLKELCDKPKNINPSTLRTVAAVIDFLAVLFDDSAAPHKHEPPPPMILVVDDEPLSRRAITHSLEKARLKSVSLEDPHKAYSLLREQSFDLIVLDVDMPGMNGFELCAKLRKLPRHEKTPVVFVTSLNDFESRANSTMSGGNDFIGKPFLFMELAVKALIYILRRQIHRAK